MTRHVVGRVAEMPPGSVRIVKIGNPQGIGVFNVGGHFYALKNVCPHQGGPLCRGWITGTTNPRFPEQGPPGYEWTRDGEIVRCPWHQWEFDIATGKTVFRSHWRVATYPVHVVDERVEEEEILRVETYPVEVADGVVIVDV